MNFNLGMAMGANSLLQLGVAAGGVAGMVNGAGGAGKMGSIFGQKGGGGGGDMSQAGAGDLLEKRSIFGGDGALA